MRAASRVISLAGRVGRVISLTVRGRVGVGVGLALLALSLAFPWLTIPLEHDRPPWQLPLVFAGVGTAPWATYGLMLAVCVVVAAAATLLTRGRPDAVAAAAGAGAVIVAFLFVFQTVISDAGLLQHLRNQATEFSSISQQFGYRIPRTKATSIMLLPLGGAWRQVASALLPAWFAAVAGGALLLIAGRHRLSAVLVDRRVQVATSLVVAGLAVLAGRGVLANLAAQSGGAAIQAGDYPTAVGRLNLALELNPYLRYSSDFEFAFGQSLKATGDHATPLALLADSHFRALEGDVPAQLADLQAAFKLDPLNPIVPTELRRVTRGLALSAHDPGILLELIEHSPGDFPADRYAVGRILYHAGDYARAIPQFRRVLQLTDDANIASSAYTYIGLSELGLGDDTTARQYILRAIALDDEYNNTLARTMAAGLYVAGRA